MHDVTAHMHIYSGAASRRIAPVSLAFMILSMHLGLGCALLAVPLLEAAGGLDKRSARLAVDKGPSAFYATLQVGSPPQSVDVIVDTGSADLWLPEPGAIRSVAGFDYSNSSSFSHNSTEFDLEYVDGTCARGFWGQDTVKLGASGGAPSVTSASLAVATAANTTLGILGLGLPGVESTVSGSIDGEPYGTYSNLPMLLKEQGIIDYMSYALSLSACNSTPGALVFGGVDTSAYNGTLATVPLVRTSDNVRPQTTSIMLHGLLSGEQSIVSCSVPVLLDSGSSVSSLPGPFIEAVARATNATWQDDLGVYVLPCASPFDVSLDLSGVQVTMSRRELVPLMTSSGGAATSDGEAMCMLPFVPSVRDYILGTGVLRCTYLVLDYEKYEAALAPRAYSEYPEHREAGNATVRPLTEISTSQAPKYSSTTSSTNYKLHVSVDGQSGVPSQVVVPTLATSWASGSSTSSSTTSTTSAAALLTASPTSTPNHAAPVSVHPLLWLALFI